MGINKGYLTAGTDKASDLVYTPSYAVYPIVSYINPQWTIWCPFDCEDSEYVNILKDNGNNVIYSDISTGQNFFSYEPDVEYDCIISNPPFSLKDKIIKRLYELQKPYAILLPIPALQGQKRFPYMIGCEALIFDKRINYYKDKKTKEIQKGISFGSFYLCKGVLPEKLIFEELDVNR